MAPVQFEVAPAPGDAVSALSFAPGTESTRLLASCWDKNVYLYDIHNGEAGGEGTLVQTFPHPGPVLDVCFGKDDSEAFSAGLDHAVRRIDLATGALQVLSRHSQGVSCIAYSADHGLVISGSWDATLHFHDVSVSGRHEPLAIQLPGKVHALSTSPTKVVVAMTARLVHIYDLPTIAALFAAGTTDPAAVKPWQQRESSLKFLTRAVACMPNDAGYATSSIEGRVAVEWFEDSAESQARKYAFKCHRQAAPEDEGGGDVVFPVNALAFHPRYGTFASGGGDGTVALWDAEAKRRMKQYQKIPNSVWALSFSGNGRYLAMGVAPGFETGQEDYSGAGKTQIIVRELSETEAKGKGGK
ncbi:cell cycle arrest protein BUB3 [Sporothrix brasiliensis 5110]|uniref:Cell cycle arrest protein BUB3 n=1 Tax=Sporothrix brasiliensis 5110 TaxID=1398154 RepID=A0A0C2IR50_9PEZI|nr:cell cycle arrest protein BUB3 [Sporothrix brasiliensis 5110]KIH89360.1 cell cycle arrest protein BUB3 [Sporothrix brasiliensis 5110]